MKRHYSSPAVQLIYVEQEFPILAGSITDTTIKTQNNSVKIEEMEQDSWDIDFKI